MASGLQASAFLVSDILSGPFLLDVPIYQRPYAWTPDEAGQLLDDLLEGAGVEPGGEPEPDYFLGSIVLMDTTNSASERLSTRMASRTFDIIDGQQRLVTVLTLFAVLRDLEKDPKAPIGKSVATMVKAQMGSRFFKSERSRIHLASRERAYFESYVLEPGSTLKSPDDAPDGADAALAEVRDHFVATLEELSGRRGSCSSSSLRGAARPSSSSATTSTAPTASSSS